MGKKNVYGHGDVIVKRIDKIPAKAIPLQQKTKNPTLAFGEVTGHSHQIASGAAQLFTYNDKTYMRVTAPLSCLKHEEHDREYIDQGDYEINIQKEYTPGGWTKVID